MRAATGRYGPLKRHREPPRQGLSGVYLGRDKGVRDGNGPIARGVAVAVHPIAANYVHADLALRPWPRMELILTSKSPVSAFCSRI